MNDLPEGAQHPRHTMAFGPDGMLYVTMWPFCYNDKEIDAYISVRPKGQTKAEFCEQSTAPTLKY